MTVAQDIGLPVEQFIQALTSQLDRVQSAMAMKAKAGLPLTFAVKDLSIDLRAHVEMVDSVVHLRPAASGEKESSMLHLTLTTITAPMIEENSRSFASSVDPSLHEALGSSITEEEQRRLEWAGIHTLSQLQTLRHQTGEAAIERVADIPVNRLRMALSRAGHPIVTHVELEAADGSGEHILGIHGANLARDGASQVHLDGRPVTVLSVDPTHLVVRLPGSSLRGTLHVETGPGTSTRHDLHLTASAEDAAP